MRIILLGAIVIMIALIFSGTGMMIFGPAETQAFGKSLITGTIVFGLWAGMMYGFFVG